MWYPPPPWRLAGEAWVGYFRADRPIPVPRGVHHVFGSRWLVVILARYLDGTLRYDELAFGVAARHGAAVGLFVDRI